MEIFNVHLFEFLLIAGLALVVFGPERLPEIGRTIGQQVARFLAWQQQSPELQMLNEVRGEFEREIASLRDELVRTRSQLDIRSDVDAIREELRPMLDLKSSLKRETPRPPPQLPPPRSPSRPLPRPSTPPPRSPTCPPRRLRATRRRPSSSTRSSRPTRPRRPPPRRRRRARARTV
jgi:sec-independent protein translocase protein TatB